jgi:hypothetical protein
MLKVLYHKKVFKKARKCGKKEKTRSGFRLAKAQLFLPSDTHDSFS